MGNPILNPFEIGRGTGMQDAAPSQQTPQHLSQQPVWQPNRAPMAMPMAMPGPSGGSGYNRYREMTLEEMLLENRVIFLVGEINHISAARTYMQMLYLQSQKSDQDINLY